MLAGALLAVIPAWSPAGAQNRLSPIAIAVVTEAVGDPSEPVAVTLDGSYSFDPNPGGSIIRYDWEILTEAYSWLPIAQNSKQSPTAMVELPSQKMADRYGYEMEFKLTVTAAGSPRTRASDSDVVTFAINRTPVALVDVSAAVLRRNPPDISDYDDNRDGQIDENAERYDIEGVIDGPGENGNAANEWDIKEGSLLVIDGSRSYDPDGPLSDSGFYWERFYASNEASVAASLPATTEGKRILSTDEDPDSPGSERSETVGLLYGQRGQEASPFYVYYRLTVTDERGAAASYVVKIVIRDRVAEPTVEIDPPRAEPASAVQPAGEDRYVVSLEAARAGVSLTARARGDSREEDDDLLHAWSGPGVVPSEANRPGNRSEARFIAPSDVAEGDEYTVTVTATDPAGHGVTASVVLVVADNIPPTVDVPESAEVEDGPHGGEDGVLRLRGIAFDPDGDPLMLQWKQVRDTRGNPIRPNTKPRLVLTGADKETVAVSLPQLENVQSVKAYIEFKATDIWGVSATGRITLTIKDGDTDTFEADAGPDQIAAPGALVRLDARYSHSPASHNADYSPIYEWKYTGITTDPPTQHRSPITATEAIQGFTAGEWLPHPDGRYHETAGGRLQLVDRALPYFFAPEIDEFNSVKLSFLLTFHDGTDIGTDTATITVVGHFYSGAIDSPDYCPNRSLGGPTTYAFDSDKDGIADICVLDTTRRAAIARQNALESLAALYPEQFMTALHGPPDNLTTADIDESESDVSACSDAPTDLGDTEDQLDADVCGQALADESPQRLASPPPLPIDPVKAPQFYSGIINSHNFCAIRSLGGPTTYAFDSDGDGIADVCALPYTRREAAARQNALHQAFASHPQYPAALAAACAALGTLEFGDHADDLDRDLCHPDQSQLKGQPLPTPASP